MENADYNHLSDPARKGRVTASSVGAILGNNPWMTRDDVMRMMVREYHGAEREFTGNIATEYGNANEQNAIMDFQLETGLTVEKAKFVTREDWAGCSPDGVCSDGWGLETKCPFSLRGGGEFKSLADQPHYYDQVQFSIWVTGREGWHFAQWQPDDLKTECVWPDQGWQDENLPILRQFYAEYLDAITEPDEHLAPKRVTVDTPEAAKMVREYDELVEQIELATERKKDLLASMVEMAGGKNAEFGGRKLTLTTRQGSVSYAKAVSELAPGADLSKWRGKEIKFWSIK